MSLDAKPLQGASSGGLVPVWTKEDILKAYSGSPVEALLLSHNLAMRRNDHQRPVALIVTCMDFRISLRMPERFAFVLRTGGANPRNVEFEIAFAVGVAGVGAICLIGHGDCAMSGVIGRRESFVRGLERHAGWSSLRASRAFDLMADGSEIGEPRHFLLSQASYLRWRFPGVIVAPLIYAEESGRLHQLAEPDGVSPWLHSRVNGVSIL